MPIDGKTPLASSPKVRPEILGIDFFIVERFLKMVRDHYKEADKAAFFLEQRVGISNVQGFTNLRDVLSHLASMLDDSSSDAAREAQLFNAEEHFRRATLEPYEIALGVRTEKFQLLYEQYLKELIPAKSEYPELECAPNDVQIQSKLRMVADLSTQGRAAKNRNALDNAWEVGALKFIESFSILEDLYSELNRHWSTFDHLRKERERDRVEQQQRDAERQHQESVWRDQRLKTKIAIYAAVVVTLGLLVSLYFNIVK